MVESFVHGSTVAINTAIERTGAPTALIVTRGTRDVYQIARGNRPESYNILFQRARAAGAAASDLRGRSAHDRLGRGARSVRRSAGQGGRTEGARQRRRGRRDLLSSFLPGSVGRTAHVRHPARGRRIEVHHRVARDFAPIGRIRAHLDHRAERLYRAADQQIRQQSGDAARAGRLWRTAAHHAVERRPDVGGHRQEGAGRHDGIRPGRRRHCGGADQQQSRLRELDRVRHGRHHRQDQPRARPRAVGRRGLLHRRIRGRSSGDDAGGRHRGSRHRRRQHCLDRRGWRAQGRPAQRGRRPGPDLLSARRHQADGHRRQRHPRPHRHRQLPRR